MSEPIKTAEQLQLEIAAARTGGDGAPGTITELIDHIITLYAAEFEKANVEIARLRGSREKIGKTIRERLDRLAEDFPTSVGQTLRMEAFAVEQVIKHWP